MGVEVAEASQERASRGGGGYPMERDLQRHGKGPVCERPGASVTRHRPPGRGRQAWWGLGRAAGQCSGKAAAKRRCKGRGFRLSLLFSELSWKWRFVCENYRFLNDGN